VLHSWDKLTKLRQARQGETVVFPTWTQFGGANVIHNREKRGNTIAECAKLDESLRELVVALKRSFNKVPGVATLIRHKKTGQYLTEDGWTTDRACARDFLLMDDALLHRSKQAQQEDLAILYNSPNDPSTYDVTW
jgi:hypothetical protein